MWSLPDIQRLNSQAQLNREKLEHAVQTGVLDGRRLRCKYSKNCLGQLWHQLWYDVFSDDPKGIITQCEYHCHQHGTPEGYFWCGACHRLMVENYTWEVYSTLSEDGQQVCLRCAAEYYIKDENNWIALTDEDIAVITFDVVRRKARHVLAVRMPVPEQIQFFDSLTLDSSTGGLIRGFADADPTPATAVEALREILRQAKEAGHDRALMILDGAYQFAVSIGVYVPAAIDAKHKANGGAREAVQ